MTTTTTKQRFPLRDSTTEGQANWLLFALKRHGFASWFAIDPEKMRWELVTDASLEQIYIHCGPVSFLQ